jgi:hypothetical protein
MTQKEITINGQNYPIVFNMQTILNFEEISNKSFFCEGFDKLKDRIALIISAVLAVDKDIEITIEEMIQADNFTVVQDVFTAYAIVMELANEFFKVPAVEPKDEKPAEEDDEKAKN